jgi:hypothetical protein
VQLPNAPQIAAVTTQCPLPGCSQVVVQVQPPIAILATAGGFGSFPLGLPYQGNSNLVRITDSTQNWSAGYTGDTRTVQIGEWSDTAISLVANVNQNGVCPMAGRPKVRVTGQIDRCAGVFKHFKGRFVHTLPCRYRHILAPLGRLWQAWQT